MTETFPASPCIGICTMDPDQRHCEGCGRTLDEIARWSRMSIPEKRRLRARLEQRLQRRYGPGHHDESA